MELSIGVNLGYGTEDETGSVEISMGGRRICERCPLLLDGNVVFEVRTKELQDDKSFLAQLLEIKMRNL